MAASNYTQTNHPSPTFVESAGGILFNPTTREICLLHHRARAQHLLPKGRRNVGESRARAAVREVQEETGVPCRLMRVDMRSRAPSVEEDEVGRGEYVGDVARWHEGVAGEPFSMTWRELGDAVGGGVGGGDGAGGEGGGVKLIWWFVLEVVEEGGGRGGGDDVVSHMGEEQFGVEWVGYEAAAEKLTFLQDREILAMAVEIVEETQKRRRRG